jgi:hypothetical protein
MSEQPSRYYVADPTDPRKWCGGFNNAYAPGTRVHYQGRLTRTRSLATVIDGHTAAVLVEGTEIPAPLAHVTVAEPGALTDGELADREYRGRVAAAAERDEIGRLRVYLGAACVGVGLGIVLVVVSLGSLVERLVPGGAPGQPWASIIGMGSAGQLLAIAGAVIMRWSLRQLDSLAAVPWIFRRKGSTQ